MLIFITLHIGELDFEIPSQNTKSVCISLDVTIQIKQIDCSKTVKPLWKNSRDCCVSDMSSIYGILCVTFIVPFSSAHCKKRKKELDRILFGVGELVSVCSLFLHVYFWPCENKLSQYILQLQWYSRLVICFEVPDREVFAEGLQFLCLVIWLVASCRQDLNVFRVTIVTEGHLNFAEGELFFLSSNPKRNSGGKNPNIFLMRKNESLWF